jgi:hypothetical protein
MQVSFFNTQLRSSLFDPDSLPEEGISFDIWLSTSELTSALANYSPGVESSVPEDLAKTILSTILNSYIENS